MDTWCWNAYWGIDPHWNHKDENKASPEDKAKALIFLRRHLDEGLKCEYMNFKEPHIPCKALNDRFESKGSDPPKHSQKVV